LVEFANEDACSELLNNVGFPSPANIIAMKSHFLWMGKRDGLKQTKSVHQWVRHVDALSEENLFQRMGELDSLSDQMQFLHDSLRMTEVSEHENL
jgi:hypothetical protein